jgi:hypothetical protein
MYGVGFCAVSRAIHTAQSLMDNAQYKEEKLGSRPKRGAIIVEGATEKQVDAISSAFSVNDEAMDNRGLTRFSMLPVLGLKTGASASLFDFASLPDGFNNLEDTQLGMSVLALINPHPLLCHRCKWSDTSGRAGTTRNNARQRPG